MKMLEKNLGGSVEEIYEIKTKSRSVIVNESGKILVANYGGVYLFPGGSVEEGENPLDTIIRELKEETGFSLQQMECFLKVNYFQNRYPTRDGRVINRLLITYYYIGYEAGAIKCERKLTEKEIKDGFELKYYSIEEIEQMLLQNKTDNPRCEYFDKEMKLVIDNYKKLDDKIYKVKKRSLNSIVK